MSSAHRTEGDEGSEWDAAAQWVTDSIANSKVEFSNKAWDTLDRYVGHPPSTEVYVHGVHAHLSSLASLRGRSWLEDECIDCGLAVLQETAKRKFRILPTLFSVVNVPSRNYDRIMKRAFPSPLSGMVVMPINLERMHWAGVIFDFEKKQKVLFDPTQDRNVYARMNKMIKDRVAPRVKTLANLNEVKFSAIRQTDSFNCGVHVLAFVEMYVNDQADAAAAEDMRLSVLEGCLEGFTSTFGRLHVQSRLR